MLRFVAHYVSFPIRCILYIRIRTVWTDERKNEDGPSGQTISLRAPDDMQSMSVDLMSGASVEEIQAS